MAIMAFSVPWTKSKKLPLRGLMVTLLQNQCGDAHSEQGMREQYNVTLSEYTIFLSHGSQSGSSGLKTAE